MPLLLIDASHVRAVCNGCGATAELCAKRELALSAMASTVPKFKAAGWHHDPGQTTSRRSLDSSLREGTGRWYCPACSRKTHL